MSREFQIGDRVQHSVGRCGDVVGDMTDGEYPVMFKDGKTLGAAPKNLTLLSPASERPPRVGDVYTVPGYVPEFTLGACTDGTWKVLGRTDCRVMSDASARIFIADGTWRLKTPGKGSVEQEAADRSEAIAKGRATYTPPGRSTKDFGLGTVETALGERRCACCSSTIHSKREYNWQGDSLCGRCYFAQNNGTPPGECAAKLAAFLVALHAPPAVCADCGKGPASLRNGYCGGPLCVYCGWRELGE